MRKIINQPFFIRCLMTLALLLMSVGIFAQDIFNVVEPVLYFYDPNGKGAGVEKVTTWTMNWSSIKNQPKYPELYNPNQLQGIVYSSSNEGVATINDDDGTINPVAPGTTTITASFGGELNVYSAVSVSYTLTYTDDRYTVEDLGLHFSLSTANAIYGDATVNTPSLETDKMPQGASYTFSSSAQGVATVDASGKVTIVGAGETVITASFAGNNSVKPGSVSYTLTVAKKEVGLQWGTTAFTYDGSAHVPTATATGLVGSDVCNVTVDGAQTNAGSFTATASALSNANYKLPAATTTTFTIAKAASAVATAPTAKALTYTGSAQELVTAGTATGGTMQYSLDAKTYAGAIPTGTNAGSYTVYYKVVGDANHEDAAGGNVSVSIAKANVTVTFASKTTSAKLGEAFASQTATTSPAGLTLSYSSSTPSVATVNATTGVVTLVAAGNTTITASFAGNDNYNAATDSYTISVSKADAVAVELSFASDKVTATYGDGTVTPPALNNPRQLPLTWSSSQESVATIGANNSIKIVGAGQTVISASFAGNDDYQAKVASFTLIVNKAKVTVEFDTDAETATIGEPFVSPKAKTTPSGLQLVYSTTDKYIAKVDGSTGEVTLRSAGKVKITASFHGSDNYEAASAYYELTVLEGEPQTPTLDPLVKELDYSMDEDYFINADGSEIDLSNTIINNILFTLKNQNSPEGDGYDTDEQCIVINTVTQTSTLNALLANGVEPGSAEYASQFTGMTFLVAAGDGFIIVTSQEAEGCYLMVKVGANEPVAINMGEMGDYNIPYDSDETTFVYMWKEGSNVANDTRTRGKKTMSDVKIRGVSHKSKARSGIQQVLYNPTDDQYWYDLSGQRISQPLKKGVYIHGNRKVVIK